jgi:hypothetical protein
MTSEESLYLAWAAALEKVAGGLHPEQQWQATAGFAAGVVELAVRCERAGVPWAELIRLARDELAEAERRGATPPVVTG